MLRIVYPLGRYNAGTRLIKRRTAGRQASLVVTLGLSQEKRLNCVTEKGVNVRRTKNGS